MEGRLFGVDDDLRPVGCPEELVAAADEDVVGGGVVVVPADVEPVARLAVTVHSVAVSSNSGICNDTPGLR